MKKKSVSVLIAIVLVAILIFFWWNMNRPLYETLLYGRIKLLRSDGETFKGWFFYEFDVSRKTELLIKIGQGFPKEEYVYLFWYLCNSTKETIESTTYWYPLTYAQGYADSKTGERTVKINRSGTFTFILALPHDNKVATGVFSLELSIKAL